MNPVVAFAVTVYAYCDGVPSIILIIAADTRKLASPYAIPKVTETVLVASFMLSVPNLSELVKPEYPLNPLVGSPEYPLNPEPE